jgi:hypothetical protein
MAIFHRSWGSAVSFDLLRALIQALPRRSERLCHHEILARLRIEASLWIEDEPGVEVSVLN